MKPSNLFLSCKVCGHGMTGARYNKLGQVAGSVGGATLLVDGIGKNGVTEYICTDCRNKANGRHKKILSRRDRRRICLRHLLQCRKDGNAGCAII